MKSKGFTLIELGVLIGVIAVLATFVFVSFAGMGENRDATVVQSIQTSLQAVVSQASTRLDLPPTQLTPQNVVNAVKVNIPGSVILDNTYRLTFPSSGRGAQFAVADNGDVKITQLTNFTRFTISPDGTIRRI